MKHSQNEDGFDELKGYHVKSELDRKLVLGIFSDDDGSEDDL